MIPENWLPFGPVEGEEDLVVDIQFGVKEPPPKLQETIWFGSKPAQKFVLNISIPE